MRFLRFSYSFVLVTAVSLFIDVDQTNAQTIFLSAPSSSITVYEGEDFASNELSNPWDGNERRDIGWEENLVSNGPTVVRSVGGVLKTEFSAKNGHVYPLFQGYSNSIFAEGLDGDRTLPRFGRKHPVDTSKYRYLSYRINLSSRSVGSISWSNESPKVIAGGGWPNQRGVYFDGYFLNGQPVHRSGYYAYMFDLSSLGTTFGPGLYDGSWSGKVISLRIEPSSSSEAGTQLDIDWIRLSDPSSAPVLNLQWTKSIIPQGFVISVGYSNSPTDVSDFTPVQQFTTTDPGQFKFPLSALPPGDYYFRVALASELTKLVSIRSNASPLVRILTAPVVSFNSPSQLSGQDYATAVISDPWDMSNSEDVANLNTAVWPQIWRQFSDYSFFAGHFNALTDVPLTSIQQTDAQVHMNVSSSHPIETSKYRYLTYRMAADDTNHPSIAQKAFDGWVMRAVGWNDNQTTEPGAFMPAGHLVYEGEHTYTYDLWDESAETLDLGSPWKSNPWLYHLRLDPLESSKQTRFSIDDVKLTAEPRPDGAGNFPVSFFLNGPGQFNVRVWASNYGGKLINPAVDRLISSLTNLSPGNHQFNWNMNALPAESRWFIKAEIYTIGLGTRVYTSQIPVVAGAFFENTPPNVVPPVNTASPLPPSISSTPLPAPQSEITLEGSRLSKRVVREGDYVSFRTKVRVLKGDKLRKISATLKSLKRTYSISLKALGKGTYGGAWRAKRGTKSRNATFNVELNAVTAKGHREKNSLGSIKVRR